MKPTKEEISDWFRTLQKYICTELEEEDGAAAFIMDGWERPGGGGGITRVIQDGKVFEKGGVNFSAVHGNLPDTIVSKLDLPTSAFYATGVSIVIHPINPFVPIIHMNVRYFELENGKYWFGGGIDLTPHYVFEDDAHFFHSQLKTTCDEFDDVCYPKFKKWADDYFYIPHRKEMRGIGGIFFDRLSENDSRSKNDIWSFVMGVGETFTPTYREIVSRNKGKDFTEHNRQWQSLRRGRYVEFNLIHDKGTRFGLETDGRTESILMSLPKNASWLYDHRPDSNSKEMETLAWLRKGVDWC